MQKGELCDKFKIYMRLRIFERTLYMYINVYCHPQTVCFVISQLFRAARHAGRFKLGSQTAYLYPRLCILPLSYFDDLRQQGNFYTFCVSFRLFPFCAIDTGLLRSLEELCIIRVSDQPLRTRRMRPRVNFLNGV